MKAVVLEARGREAAMLMTDGTVRRVRGRYAVGQEIDFLESARLSARQWILAAVIAAILLGGSVGMWINNNYVTCAEVGLDANPAIAYSLNRRNRVLSVRAINPEAAALAEALSGEGIRFVPLADALDRAIEMFAEAEDCLLASVSTDSAAARDALSAQVEAAIARAKARHPAIKYRIECTDRAAARAAQESGMTAGRYAAWQRSPGGESPEVYAHLPVAQILGDTADSP